MTAAAGAGDDGHAPSDATRRPTRSGRELWPFAVFVVLAIAFCAPALAPGHILMPTNPTFFQPWVNDPDAGALEGRSNGLMGDALIFSLPGRIWNHEMLSRGQIPLWNPYVFAGYPHLALIQNNALYPLSAPFDAIEPLSGLALSALLHLALAGALMYVFLRRIGLDASAAAIGGAAFELNGMFLVRVSAPSYVYSGIWLPLLLLGAHSIAAAPRLRFSLAVVVGTALSVLGGHPQMTSLALVLAGAYLIFATSVRAHTLRERALAIARASGAFGASVVLAVGIAGFQVVPFLELMAHSAREVMSLEAYRASSLPFAGLLQALVPDVFGNPVDRNYWLARSVKLLDGLRPQDRFWAVNYSGGNVYTGMAPLVLAAIALLHSERRKETLFFALAAVASLGVLVGSPVLDLAYVAVPGFRYSRPDRVLFVYMASVAVLSALGFAALLRTGHGANANNRARQALAVAALAAILIAWRVVPRVADPAARGDLVAWVGLARGYWSEQSSTLLPNALLQLAALVGCLVAAIPAVRRRVPRPLWLGIWLVLLTLPNLVFGWRFNPAQLAPRFGTTEVERLLLDRAAGGRIARIVADGQFLPANVSQLIGLRDVNGASAAGVADYLGLIEAADPGSVAKQKYFRSFDHATVARGPLLDVLSASLVVSDQDLDEPYESIGSVGEIEIYRNPRALPRFRLVSAYDLVDSVEEARARLVAPGFDAAGRVVLSRPTSGSGTLPFAPRGDVVPMDLAKLVVERDDPERIRLHIDTPADAILVTSEVFYPGWEARVDGVPTEVLRANAAFRALVVPRGSHAIELSFEPRSLRIGVFVSLCSALVLAAASFADRRRSRSAAVEDNGASAARATAPGPAGS